MRRSRPLTSGFVFSLVSDLVQFVSARLRSRTALVAENLFLRKQLAFYREHKVRPRPLTDAARLSLVFWSRLFDWKNALMIVKPGTLLPKWVDSDPDPKLKRELDPFRSDSTFKLGQ